MVPNPPQIGSTGRSRNFGTEVAAQMPREADPTFIVRYRPRPQSGPTPCDAISATGNAEAFFMGRPEADEFALSLVHRGETEPDSIAIYENTAARVVVQVQDVPRPGAR